MSYFTCTEIWKDETHFNLHFSTLFKSQVIKPVDLLMDWHDSGIFRRVNPNFGNPMYFHHIVLSVSQCFNEGYHFFLGSLTILLKEKSFWPFLAVHLTSKVGGRTNSLQGFLVALNKIYYWFLEQVPTNKCSLAIAVLIVVIQREFGREVAIPGCFLKGTRSWIITWGPHSNSPNWGWLV